MKSIISVVNNWTNTLNPFVLEFQDRYGFETSLQVVKQVWPDINPDRLFYMFSYVDFLGDHCVATVDYTSIRRYNSLLRIRRSLLALSSMKIIVDAILDSGDQTNIGGKPYFKVTCDKLANLKYRHTPELKHFSSWDTAILLAHSVRVGASGKGLPRRERSLSEYVQGVKPSEIQQ